MSPEAAAGHRAWLELLEERRDGAAAEARDAVRTVPLAPGDVVTRVAALVLHARAGIDGRRGCPTVVLLQDLVAGSATIGDGHHGVVEPVRSPHGDVRARALAVEVAVERTRHRGNSAKDVAHLAADGK